MDRPRPALLLPLAALGVLLVRTPALAAAPEKVWMITGTGKSGDCMAEWMLRWDAAFDPDLPGFDPGDPNDPSDGRHPRYSPGGARGRLSTVQECVDGAPCDQDTVAGQCTFHVGLCFCVNDPDTPACGATRYQWCTAPHPPAEDLAPLYYAFSRPSRTTTDPAQSLDLCRLTRALAGSGEPCDPVVPDFPEGGPTPLLTGGDTIELLPPDQTSLEPNRNPRKVVFRLTPDPVDTLHRSPLHVITDTAGVTEGGVPYRPYLGQGGHHQFVRRFARAACTDLVRMAVTRGERRARSILLPARWEPDQNPDEIDRGGGDKLKLTCLAPD